MSETDYSCDFMKPLDLVCEADPRNAGTYPEFIGGGQRKIDLFHERISKYSLSEPIPVEVRIHYETAKNIYLYSWFVFRFFNVAEHQALTSLELGLKELYKDELPEKVGLSRRLRHAKMHGHIKREDFELYRHRVWLSARERYWSEKHLEMDEKGLESIILDDSEVVVTDDDHFDYLDAKIKRICDFRNDYAHGSKDLYEGVLHTFEFVSETLNSAYRRKYGQSA